MAAKEESASEAERQQTPALSKPQVVNGHHMAGASSAAADKVAETLNNAIKGPSGLTIRVDGAASRTIRTGQASSVLIGEVWAYFKLGIYGYRTQTTADRDALLAGDTAISCVQLIGPKSAAAESIEPEKPKGFIPRSKGPFGRQHADLVMT